jgi:hypothetical protein
VIEILHIRPWQSVVVRFKSDYCYDDSGAALFEVERQDIPWQNKYTLECSAELFKEIQRLSTKYDFASWEFELCNRGNNELTILANQEIDRTEENKDEKNHTQLAPEESRLP